MDKPSIHETISDTVELLTAEEVAAQLRLKPRTVLQLARSREIGCVRVSNRVRFQREEVEAFIRSRTVLPPKTVDVSPPKCIPSRRKGGKSAADSDKAQIRKGLRQWL